MCLDKVGALMAQKVHDLVFVSAGTPGLDLTWSPSEGVMMMTNDHALLNVSWVTELLKDLDHGLCWGETMSADVKT